LIKNYDYYALFESPEQVEIRVDANGAFDENEALNKSQLSEFKLHSIEQPIQNHTDRMAEFAKLVLSYCVRRRVGIIWYAGKEQLLTKIKPQYIILKPSFVGGFRGTQEWISLAEKHQIGWWITSALESNIGLNAMHNGRICSKFNASGIRTGALYTNNFDSPLTCYRSIVV
jgi:L-alanine-DL-glutamate epimerase-like enolase superfamily enzyme